MSALSIAFTFLATGAVVVAAGTVLARSGDVIAARTQLNEMPWAMTGDDPNGDFKGLKQLFTDTEATPIDVPLHPGVERFLKDKRL